MLRFALPAYRLPREVLDREIEIIRRLGVQFVLNSSIGADISLSDLEAKFDAVFLSLGTWKETEVRVPGNELAGVLRRAAFPGGARRSGEAVRTRRARRHHRRRQCRHRLRPHGDPHGRIGDRHLPARAQGHAGHRGGGRGRRGGRRALHLPGLAASHRRRTRRGQGDRGDQDPARRVRYIRAAATDRHRRGADRRLQQRHPRGRRERGPRVLPRLRPRASRRTACSRSIATR